MLLICRDLGGGGNYLLNALVFSVKKEARSFLKVKMREEMWRPEKRMGNSRQRGEMERLGTYCVMTDCIKCPREVLRHAFKMRLVRVVCFSPQLCLAAQVQVQSSEELNLPNELKIPSTHGICLIYIKHVKLRNFEPLGYHIRKQKCLIPKGLFTQGFLKFPYVWQEFSSIY